jgi:hypothetical protein
MARAAAVLSVPPRTSFDGPLFLTWAGGVADESLWGVVAAILPDKVLVGEVHGCVH